MAEEVAFRYLLDQGFILLARNWRAGRSEVDLVMKDQDTLVFVEVKSRNAKTYRDPSEVIGEMKEDALVRARDAWWDQHGQLPHFRIDLVVILTGKEDSILYFPEVI